MINRCTWIKVESKDEDATLIAKTYRVNTSHFLCPTVDVSPYFNGPKANK